MHGECLLQDIMTIINGSLFCSLVDSRGGFVNIVKGAKSSYPPHAAAAAALNTRSGDDQHLKCDRTQSGTERYLPNEVRT